MFEKPIVFTFPISQKKLLGIAIAFYGLYKFFLKDPVTVKDLGSWYAVFLQVWIVVMLFCAGFSGWEFALYLWELVKEKLKPKAKEDKE